MPGAFIADWKANVPLQTTNFGVYISVCSLFLAAALHGGNDGLIRREREKFISATQLREPFDGTAEIARDRRRRNEYLMGADGTRPRKIAARTSFRCCRGHFFLKKLLAEFYCGRNTEALALSPVRIY